MIAIRVEPDGTVVVQIKSEALDIASAEGFRRACETEIPPGTPRVILDFQRVEFMDSSGLSSVVSLNETLRSRGACLALASPSASVRTLLRLTSMDRCFAIADDVAQARTRLGELVG